MRLADKLKSVSPSRRAKIEARAAVLEAELKDTKSLKKLKEELGPMTGGAIC